MTGLLDFGEFLSLDADNLPSAVYLSSVHTPQPSSENLGLMRYRGNLSGHLVSALWEYKSPQLRRVTGKNDLGESMSMDADNLSPAVYLSPVETQPTSNDGYFMLVKFEARQAQISGCACSKHKCPLKRSVSFCPYSVDKLFLQLVCGHLNLTQLPIDGDSLR